MRWLVVFVLAGCTEGLPPIGFRDLSSVPVGASLSVAPCHPGDTPAACAMRLDEVLHVGESSARAGIFGIPAGVTQFSLQVSNNPGSTGGTAECRVLDVIRNRTDQKIKITGGLNFDIECERSSDCGAQAACL